MFSKYPLDKNLLIYNSFSNYTGYDTKYIENIFLRFHMNRIFKYIKCIKNSDLLRNCMNNMIYVVRAFMLYYNEKKKD